MTEIASAPEHQRELILRFLAEPGDVNYGGKVHGGIVMKWIDQAGYAAAVGWCGRYAVTVAVGGIRFVAPIGISDLVSINAKLVYTGSTSMHIAVDVSARDPMGGPERLCTHCVIVFVAVDQLTGRPLPVPQLTQESDEDRRLAEYALKVMDLSKDIEQTIARYRDAETDAHNDEAAK
ncbi:acyl-CoA thioesterase [Solilutibacter silvestris]|uniref:Acyl-CoA hydrolase n=1 Tax=Solilutibacter silvestris TaxID=1645665 RepID=A0A2K1Q3M8_9GAMM|nr:acyl-CoA thioesterase [Lysobacter silvestris]PNS09655.1 Acyl-CoA hydrolase [Lysobacter silvestris]